MLYWFVDDEDEDVVRRWWFCDDCDCADPLKLKWFWCVVWDEFCDCCDKLLGLCCCDELLLLFL